MARRDLDPQHDQADFRLVVVQAVPLEADHVLFGDVVVVHLAELVDFVEDLERVLLALQLLDVVPLADQVPVGRGAGAAAAAAGRAAGAGRAAAAAPHGPDARLHRCPRRRSLVRSCSAPLPFLL